MIWVGEGWWKLDIMEANKHQFLTSYININITLLGLKFFPKYGNVQILINKDIRSKTI